MQKILHFHIPKTGGIAIQHYFIERLGKDRVSDSILGRRLKDALVQFDYLDVLSGHFLLQQGDHLPQDRCCITILRNPIDRFLSEYFYSKSDRADRFLDGKLQALSLDAYLEQLPTAELEAMSGQIGMLYPLGTSSREGLSLAEKFTASVKAIDAFEFIGVQEELEDLACILDVKFGWEHTALKLKNVTSQRIKAESLAPQHIQKLRSLLAHEHELYECAKSRFQTLRREFILRSIAVVCDNDANLGKTSPITSQITDSSSDEHPVEFGDRDCTIEEVSITGEISGVLQVMVGEHFDILLRIKAKNNIDVLNASIAIKDGRGLLMFSTNSMMLGHIYSLNEGEHIVHFTILNRLPRGSYCVDAALMKGESQYAGCYHWRENVAAFTVYDSVTPHFEGLIYMDANVFLTSKDEDAKHTCKPYAASNNQVRALGRVNPKLRQFDAVITPMAPIENLFSGMDINVPVRLENTSKETWAAYGRQPVALTYRWLAKDGNVVTADGVRTRLPADVPPGAAVIVPMQISIPSGPQSLLLVVSLVQESVAWFVDRNPDSAYVISVELG